MKLQILFALLATLPTILAASPLDSAHQGSTTSDALARAYDKNPVAADQIYKGRQFQIGGTVKEIESDEEVYLDLTAPSDLRNIYRVHCVFSNTAGLERLKTGSRVTLTGTVEGKRGSFILVSKCVLH